MNNQLKEQMFGLINEWQNSKQTKKEFLKDKEISLAKFHYWQKLYRTKGESHGGFVALSVGSTSCNGIEVNYPNGLRITFPITVPPVYIQKFIDTGL